MRSLSPQELSKRTEEKIVIGKKISEGNRDVLLLLLSDESTAQFMKFFKRPVLSLNESSLLLLDGSR